ncbi:MAG: lysophospholipid acyltransferase family protein [Holophagales bacterium]|nr:lysophospholipid acyltransferase family protein [Holophagales bacterium]
MVNTRTADARAAESSGAGSRHHRIEGDGGSRRPATAPSWGRRILGPLHVYGVFWPWLHISGIRFVPRFLTAPILTFFVAFFFLFLGRIRDAIAANLETVLGPCGFWERQRRVWRNLCCYAWCMTERNEDLTCPDRRVMPEVEGEENWREVLEHGTGFVLVTAHIGHWEVGSAYPVDLQGRRVHIVRQVEIDEAAQAFLKRKIEARNRGGYVVHFVEPASDTGSLGPKLLLALRDGDAVALQGDRPATGGRAIEVPLFGRPFAVPLGPAAIARTAGAPLLPVFVYRTGRSRSRLVLRPPILIEKSDDRDADLRRIAGKIVEEVEGAIRRDPFQWFCFERLWPTSKGAMATATPDGNESGSRG